MGVFQWVCTTVNGGMGVALFLRGGGDNKMGIPVGVVVVVVVVALPALYQLYSTGEVI